MKDSLIIKINNLHHYVLSHFAEKDNPNFQDFRDEVKYRFGFEKKFDWNILLNALYLIEDTEFAKISFLKFDLQGPARYDDIGERYLRLYGILNAVYQQFLAISNLLEIYKIPNKKILIEEFKKTEMIILRNKIGSHSANHLSIKENSENNFDVFEISRYALQNGRITILKNQSEFQRYDLKKEIMQYDKLAIDNLYNIVAKAIKKAFNNQSHLKKDLDVIKEEIDGIRIFRSPNESNIIIDDI